MNDNYISLIVSTLEKLKASTNYVWAYQRKDDKNDAFVLNFNGKTYDEGYYSVTCGSTIPINDEEWEEITLERYHSYDDQIEVIEEVLTYNDLVIYLNEVAPELSQWMVA